MSLSHLSLPRAVIIAALSGAGLAEASFLASSRPAQGADLRMTVERPHFTCEGSGAILSHAAYHAERRPSPEPVLPCCDGRLACAQFLSTSTILRPLHQWHG